MHVLKILEHFNMVDLREYPMDFEKPFRLVFPGSSEAASSVAIAFRNADREQREEMLSTLTRTGRIVLQRLGYTQAEEAIRTKAELALENSATLVVLANDGDRVDLQDVAVMCEAIVCAAQELALDASKLFAEAARLSGNTTLRTFLLEVVNGIDLGSPHAMQVVVIDGQKYIRRKRYRKSKRRRSWWESFITAITKR